MSFHIVRTFTSFWFLLLLLVLQSCVQGGSSDINFTAPIISNGGADLQFTDDGDEGNDVRVTWNAFSQARLYDHKLLTYTDSSCTLGEVDHGATGSATNSDSSIIDGLTTGTYWGKVVAIGYEGKETEGECSTDSIIIDQTAPAGGSAVTFTQVADGNGNKVDADGDDIGVSWTAFTDPNPYLYKLRTYTDSGCSLGEVTHGTGVFSATSDSTTIDGLSEGKYWAKIIAYDVAGNETSFCSTDIIFVDSAAPRENALGLDGQFTDDVSIAGQDYEISWNGFTDGNLNSHVAEFYVDGDCGVNPLYVSIPIPSALIVDEGGGRYSTTVTAAQLTASAITGPMANNVYELRIVADDEVLLGPTNGTCSTDTLIVDNAGPVVGANVYFDVAPTSFKDNQTININWDAATDNISSYSATLHVGTTCAGAAVATSNVSSATLTTTFSTTGLAEGTYSALITATDLGNRSSTLCSNLTGTGAASIVIDKTSPDNTGVQVTIASAVAAPGSAARYDDGDGNNVVVNWDSFTDLGAVPSGMSDYDIVMYPVASTTVPADPCPTSGGVTTNVGGVATDFTLNGLIDGYYRTKVIGKDAAGNQTTSACSTNILLVDTLAPTSGGTNLAFDTSFSITGTGFNVSWDSYTDPTLSDHEITFYPSLDCSGVGVPVNTGSSSNTYPYGATL